MIKGLTVVRRWRRWVKWVLADKRVWRRTKMAKRIAMESFKGMPLHFGASIVWSLEAYAPTAKMKIIIQWT